MAGEQLQHVVQKAAPGVHLVAAGAVQIKGKVDLGLIGVAFQRDHSVRHGSFLHDLIQCVHEYLHLFRCANGDVDWWVSKDGKYGVNVLTTIQIKP